MLLEAYRVCAIMLRPLRPRLTGMNYAVARSLLLAQARSVDRSLSVLLVLSRSDCSSTDFTSGLLPGQLLDHA